MNIQPLTTREKVFMSIIAALVISGTVTTGALDRAKQSPQPAKAKPAKAKPCPDGYRLWDGSCDPEVQVSENIIDAVRVASRTTGTTCAMIDTKQNMFHFADGNSTAHHGYVDDGQVRTVPLHGDNKALKGDIVALIDGLTQNRREIGYRVILTCTPSK